ncbi:hypothetical protein ACNKHO_07525 [Shigella flexneri]
MSTPPDRTGASSAMAYRLRGLPAGRGGADGLSVINPHQPERGVTDEHAIGKAFTEALPFTALLAVFFAGRGGDDRPTSVRADYRVCAFRPP